MSIPPSPFNIFTYFKSETFAAAASQDVAYNNLKRWIQEERDKCEPYEWPQSALKQPWEMPVDTTEMTAVTPHCQQCYDQYEEDGSTVRRRSCNEANWHTTQTDCESGIIPSDTEDFGNYEYKWVTEKCVATVKSHMIKETPPNPTPLPTGWRVTPSGHLTNLPEDLDVSDKTDALKNGVYVISEIGSQYQREGDNWTPEKLRKPLTDRQVKIGTTASVVNTIPEYSYPLPSFEAYAPCIWKDLKDGSYARQYNILTEDSCRHQGWKLWSYHPMNQSFGTLQQVINYMKGENYLDKFYWWVEAPLFTTACPDDKYEEYMTANDAGGVIDYWDPSKCKTLKAGESEASNQALPSMIIGGVAVIVVGSFLFSKIGGV